MGERDESDCLRAENLGSESAGGQEQGGMVETCQISSENDLRTDPSSSSTLGPNRQLGDRPTKRRKRYRDFEQEIETFIMQYPTTPMINITQTVPWLSDPDMRMIRQDDYNFKRVTDMVMSRIATWNFYDFKLLYQSNVCNPLFNALDVDTTSIYYSVEDSLGVILDLLMFQFGDELSVISFLKDLWNVCEKKIPKFNTIVIHSPPSAGKNFFFDMVLAFYWSKGQMGNPNRFNTFAYSECVNKRIILWNEPNYASEETDMLKMILGGDNFTARVKYKNDVAVNRTPVIVLTNTAVNFMHDPAFADRIKVYRWMTCPKLKEHTMKPHPMCLIELFLKYNIC